MLHVPSECSGKYSLSLASGSLQTSMFLRSQVDQFETIHKSLGPSRKECEHHRQCNLHKKLASWHGLNCDEKLARWTRWLVHECLCLKFLCPHPREAFCPKILGGGGDLRMVQFSSVDTMSWWGHSNPTICKGICLNFLQSQVRGGGMQKFWVQMLVSGHEWSHHGLHPSTSAHAQEPSLWNFHTL